jgi:FAD/FMN-containing dehydrogenase
MAATNAGGAQVFRYGSMRAQVAGFEAVLADGSVVRRMGGLLKDNSGYDLAGLLVGSEGTLAIFTALTLRLIPRSARRLTGLLALPGVESAVALAAHLRGAVPSLTACELLLPDGIALVCAHRRLPQPFALSADAACVLVECAADDDPAGELAAALDRAPAPLAQAFADDSAGRARLWAYREEQNESVGYVGVPCKFDVTIPHASIASFLADVRAQIAEAFPAAHLYAFGHLCDGNLHLNVVGAPLDADAGLDALVLGIVAAYDGSISAEHGVGQTRRDYLGLTRSAADIAAMHAIKRALDPLGQLNPGKVLGA